MPSSSDTVRVLVVDDWVEMAEMLADDLCDRGYAATAVSSGTEALRILQTKSVDALVTDLRMPEVDGLSLLRASIELDPSRPVIVMTAYSAFDTAMEASGGGAFQYLMKPFRLDALARVLEQALKR
jgi:DNA-binding NtrC family response regulator